MQKTIFNTILGIIFISSSIAAADHRQTTTQIDQRPNVIIILADDLGCGDMSLYDGWIETPRIDK
ncbi:MAG: arylsulfatase, partial [Planctomycetota bacterium]